MTSPFPASLFPRILDRQLCGVLVCRAMREETGQVVNATIVYVNRQAAEWLGRPVDFLTTHPLSELSPDIPALFDHLLAVLRTGQPTRFVLEHPAGPLQPVRWFDVLAEPLDDEVVCSFTDITEQKKAEIAFREQSNFISQIADAVPGTVSVYDLVQKRIVYLNRRQFSRLGYSDRELDEMSHLGWIDRIVHPDDRPALWRLLDDLSLAEDDSIRSLQYRIQTKSGDWEWRRIRSKVFKRNEAGVPLQVISQIHNITAEKAAEEALREEHRRLKEAQAIGHVGSFEWDLDPNTVYWSDEMHRIHGLEPKQLPIRIDDIPEFAHPEDRAFVKETITKALSQTGTGSFSHRLLRPNGEVRFVQRRYESFADEAGRITHVKGTVQDITDLKEAQLRLEQSEALLRSAEEVAHAGSYEVELATMSFRFSNGMFRLFGEEPQSFVPTLDFIDSRSHPDDVPVVRRVLDQAAADRQPYQYTRRICRTDGQWRLVESHGRVVCDAAGNAIRFLGVVQDITERRQAEEELQQSKALLQAVLNTSPAFIALFQAVPDPEQPDEISDFRLAVGNEKLARFVGESLPALINQSVDVLHNHLWGAQTVENLRRVYRSNQPFYDEKVIFGTEDDRWIAISATRQDDGVVLTGMDITELKQAQARQQHWLTELQQASQSARALAELRSALRHRGELLRAASHDLRGNVGVISSATQLLGMVSTEAERNQIMELILRNVRQMTQLMTNLLDFARLESGQQTRTIGSLDAADLLRELAESVIPVAQQQGLWLRSEGPPALRVEGDAVNLRRIGQNILLNALKYTSKGGVTLSWGVDTEGSRWWFRIADTGEGLPAELLEQLTRASGEPPVVADISLAPSAGAAVRKRALFRGEGIGLQIVKELVKLLEAELSVHSPSGGGTVFTVLLPMRYS